MRPDLLARQMCSGLEGNITHHLLAVDRIRDADSAGLSDLGEFRDDTGDLERRDVDASSDYQVLGAASHVEITVVVEISELAGPHSAYRHTPAGAVRK